MMWFRKNKKQKNKKTISYTVKDVDNLISIAQSYGVPWKELAEFNGIEPPYILIAGEVIKIPQNSIDKSKKIQESDKEKDNKKESDNKVVEGEIKNAENEKPKKQNLNNEVQQQGPSNKQQLQKKKQKIIFASPKNMLQKPTAEPTTRAIDIDWMQEDEEAYEEELKTQQKRLSIKLFIFAIVFGGLALFTLWHLGKWAMERFRDDEGNSIEVALKNTEQDDANRVEVKNNDKSNSNGEIVIENKEENAADKTEIENQVAQNNQDNEVKENQNSEIKVQVLNAGATIGSAGEVSEYFEKQGYDVMSAKNSKNDYEGVVVYYNADVGDRLEEVSKVIPRKYGNQKHEESKEVTDMYNADFVVVLGA